MVLELLWSNENVSTKLQNAEIKVISDMLTTF